MPRSIAEQFNRQTFGSLTLTGTLTAAGTITSTGGNLVATAGDVVAGDDVIANDDVVAGDTVDATGNIIARSNIVVNKASGAGILVDPASPSYYWQDMLGTIGPRATGATAPTFAAWQGGIYAYRFDRAGMQEVFVNFHFVHDYAPGTDVYVHAHWSTAAAPAGSCNWLFEATYAKGYDQAAFEGTSGSATTITTAVEQTPTGAFRHNIAEVLLSTPGGLVSSAINVSITAGTPTLTSASALFSAGDIGRTIRVVGAGAAGGNLDTTITAFTSTTQVTLGANAGTTVTTQPNFRWRILDSSLFEVDGVICVRCWNDKTRAADTLSVDPFLHFCDMHYQSVIVGTKQRNGPNFYV